MVECPVCLEDLNKLLNQKFKCKHKFCVGCVTQLGSFSCPLCRRDIKTGLTVEQQKIIQKRILSQKEQIPDAEILEEISPDDFIRLITWMLNSDEITLTFSR